MLHNDFNNTCIGKLQSNNTYKSKHEITMDDLNWYMTNTLCLLIILMDDTITFTIPSYKIYQQLTNNFYSDNSISSFNRISYITCVCSIITCSNTINGVVSTEHCTSTSIIYCSDISGL